MDSIRVSVGVRASLTVAAGMAFSLCAPISLAQQASGLATGAAPDQLQEIVITAQKRTERLEDVPVSAAVVSTNTLADSNVSDVSDLNKLVPSLNINGTISGRAPMGMRGVSTVSNESSRAASPPTRSASAPTRSRKKNRSRARCSSSSCPRICSNSA